MVSIESTVVHHRGYFMLKMCHITLSFFPAFSPALTRNEVDIAEKVLMGEQYTIHNENCCPDPVLLHTRRALERE